MDNPTPPTNEELEECESYPLTAEVRRLRMENAKLEKDVWRERNHGQDAVDALLIENGGLREKLEELQRDAERWRGLVKIVEREEQGIEMWLGRRKDLDDEQWLIREMDNRWEEWHATADECIDAAMAREREDAK